jgi:hypothetical protein
MSYLQTKVESFENSIQGTYKDGNFDLANKKKIIPEFIQLIYTVPLFHQRFKLWADPIEKNLLLISQNTNERCLTKCKMDNVMTGKNTLGISSTFNKCQSECHSKWVNSMHTFLQVILCFNKES